MLTTTTTPTSRTPTRRKRRRLLPLASTDARRCWRLAWLLVLVAALLASASRTALAAPTSVVVEIDAVAERLVDPRSAHRLVPLELSDVALPVNGSARGASVLFFRVLGRADGSLRIELWERGEYHGARVLSGAGENPQLVARRVALAAAELGRRLARKREATLARDERLKKAREARARDQRERTQDGPVALRSELALGAVPGKMRLFGQRVAGELTLRGPLRLDVGAEHWTGSLQPALSAELAGLHLGPAYRIALTRGLDLDLALLIAAPQARSLDAIVGQDSSWTARLSFTPRFEARLGRQVRALLAADAGGLLRTVPYGADERPQHLRGFWWGASIGVVVTPP
jgi:hypothetical protein